MHGVQGDCEFFGIADETAGEVQIRCDVVKGKQIPFPRIEHTVSAEITRESLDRIAT